MTRCMRCSAKDFCKSRALPAALRQGAPFLQVAGTVAADTLHLGNITVKNQGFGLVLSSSSDFLDISCDGLFVSPPVYGCQDGRPSDPALVQC